MANNRQETADTDVSEGDGYKGKKYKRKLTPFGRFLDIIGTLIMLVALLVSLAFTVPKVAGIQSYVVVSGSMEPTIPVGSLVYARKVEPATLEPGDIIVFFSTDAASLSNGGVQNGAIPIVHRVMENHTEIGEIITKGDANNSIDLHPATYVNIEGKVFAHVSGLGRLAVPFTTAQGKIATVLIILAGFLLAEVGNQMKR